MLRVKNIFANSDFYEELDCKSAELISGGVDPNKGEWRACKTEYYIDDFDGFSWYYEPNKRECKKVKPSRVPFELKEMVEEMS